MGYHRNRDSSYSPDQCVTDLKNDMQAVANKVGHLGKPVIVGETGWQSRMYGDSSVAKLQEYYTKITKHVYQVRDPNIQPLGNGMALARYRTNPSGQTCVESAFLQESAFR